jgi:hypothetical protein
MNIIFLPFHDYKLSLLEGFRTRDAHIYGQSIKDPAVDKVIIINRPTLLLEVLLKRKTSKTAGTIIYSNSTMTIQKISDKVYIIDILDLSMIKPILKGKGFISELYFRNRKLIQNALIKLECKDFVSYESSPLTRETVDFLSPRKKVFDGVDNFCKHDSYAALRERLRNDYNKIINNYESIFFNGKDSLDYFNCSDNERVEFMANGVDVARFQNDYPQPKSYTKSQENNKKIAVYAGKMQSMFDVELVRELAIANPAVDFYFLGKILEGQPDKDLAEFTNVVFVGDVHYDSLPAYITNATVCIIPYLVNKQHGGDPIKFYEYLASGSSIVSTCIGDIQRYHDSSSVFIVNKENFVKSFNTALLKGDIKESRTIPEHMTWQYKARYMFKQFGGNT